MQEENMRKSRLSKLIESVNQLIQRSRITEASLGRIWQHLKSARAFAMISAFRSEYVEIIDGVPSERWNRVLNHDMKEYVTQAGYGFFPLEGHYTETTKSEGEVDRKEESIFIIDNKNDPDKFKEFICDLGQKFKQDSVFIKDADGKGYLIYTRNTDSFRRGQMMYVGDELFANPRTIPTDQNKIFSRVKGRKFRFGKPDEG